MKWIIGFLAASTLFLLSPIRDIRLGYLHADSLGGFIAQADLALVLLPRLGDSDGRSAKNYFLLPTRHANPFVVQQYVELIRKLPSTSVLDVSNGLTHKIVRLAALGLEYVAIRHPGLRRNYCGSPSWYGMDANGIEEDGRPRLVIETEVREQGWDKLSLLGIDRQKPLICFGNRDFIYWDSHARQGELSDGRGSSQDFRNTSITSFLPAITRLIDAGYTVVRMGAGAAASTALTDLGVVDYANSSIQSDILDVLLFADCDAAIFGGAFGLSQLALAFHKPVCVTDYRPFILTEWSTPHCQITPSLLRNVETGETLNLERMMQYPYNAGALYELEGIEFVPNTASDIESSVIEFVEALKDPGLRSSESDLQRKFWAGVSEKRLNYAWFHGPDGRSFKRYNFFNSLDYGWTPRHSRVSESFLTNHARELFN